VNLLESRRTALVLIDLMPRIIALETAPLSGSVVLERSAALAAEVQPEGSGFAPEAAPQPGDLVIVKQTMGAFGRTPLDTELQSRGIANVVLAGIATNFGVESTGRAASDLGYETFFLTDAMTGLDDHAHNFAISYTFPRLGTVCTTPQYLNALNK
jgi:nicotinamidase-related amidase